MSCLLKQWLVIKCTKDALHLRQCTGMYVYKIYNYWLLFSWSSSIICRLSQFPLLYRPYHLRKCWAGEGGCLFEWGVGAYLGKGAYYRVGALFQEIWYVLVFAWYTFSDFCLFFKSKKHMQKTLWHHLFLTFGQKQKQACLCFAKSAVWDIYKDQIKY